MAQQGVPQGRMLASLFPAFTGRSHFTSVWILQSPQATKWKVTVGGLQGHWITRDGSSGSRITLRSSSSVTARLPPLLLRLRALLSTLTPCPSDMYHSLLNLKFKEERKRSVFRGQCHTFWCVQAAFYTRSLGRHTGLFSHLQLPGDSVALSS